MVPGLLITSAATFFLSAALFGRRSRGWVDELDGIRGQALSEPEGEVTEAMGDDAPESLDDDPSDPVGRSPLTSLEAPLPPAGGTTPHRVAPIAARGLAGPDLASLPAPPAPPVAPPMASATPSPEAMASPPTPPPPLSSLLQAASAPKPPVVRPPVSPVAPPPPGEPAYVPPLPPTPPLPPPMHANLPEPPAPASFEEIPADEPPVVDRPIATFSPHPVRPHEMWHAPITPVTSAGPPPSDPAGDRVEERVELAELVEPEVVTSRFRFARLRPVGSDQPSGSADAIGRASAAELGGSGAGDDPTAVRPVPGPFDLPPAPPGEPWSVDHGAVPLVPLTGASTAGALINGPVTRRPVADPPEVRRGLPAARTNGALPPVAPEPVEPVGSQPDEPIDPVEGNRTVDAPAVPEATSQPDSEPAQPESGDLEQRDLEPREAGASAATGGPLDVADDGTVELDGSHLRLGDRSVAVATDDGIVSLELTGSWCWNVLAPTGPAVQVALPTGSLTVPAGTQALAVVEADGSSFVVVVEGEATLVLPGGRKRLRRGAMALTQPGGEPQVDVASPDEIEADPLVQRNLALDADR